jgi:hypothetical protein
MAEKDSCLGILDYIYTFSRLLSNLDNHITSSHLYAVHLRTNLAAQMYEIYMGRVVTYRRQISKLSLRTPAKPRTPEIPFQLYFLLL